MNQHPKAKDANRFEVAASFKSVANTQLARAVHGLNAWTSYDRHQAHTWALRLIKANPVTGQDVAAALINFDYMVPAARANYDAQPRYRAKCDAILSVYTGWMIATAAPAKCGA